MDLVPIIIASSLSKFSVYENPFQNVVSFPIIVLFAGEGRDAKLNCPLQSYIPIYTKNFIPAFLVLDHMLNLFFFQLQWTDDLALPVFSSCQILILLEFLKSYIIYELYGR